MQVLCYTHTKAHWCLPPFAYLWGKYWSELQPVYVAGGVPDVVLPSNFMWMSVASRIVERWSDGFLEALNALTADIVCIMLEDYALVRTVDVAAVGSLEEYMTFHPDIMKIDLTNDRLHSGHAVDVGYWGHCDLIETDWETPYQFSLQASLWRREHLIASLRPEMSPWDFELQDQKYKTLRVMGTRNWPVRYANLVGMQLDSKYRYRTEHIRDGLGGRTIERIDPEHIKEMLRRGILPPQEK